MTTITLEPIQHSGLLYDSLNPDTDRLDRNIDAAVSNRLTCHHHDTGTAWDLHMHDRDALDP